ncbi:unnamed protein product [Caenorhabditis sp. 36 PRJEB53466]|nr:unnamed protein product [Caenorhabditis sp. 36 PRJEB53466]
MVPVSENSRPSNQAKPMCPIKFAAAEKQAAAFNEKVTKLIDLIEYPECISNTFLNCLGNILVVESLPCARAIAYDKEVHLRVITTRGEDVRHTGVMSAGKLEQGNKSTLLTFAPLVEMREREVELWQQMDQLKVDLKRNESLSREYERLNSELTEKARKLTQIKNNMKNSEIGVVQKDLDEAKKVIADSEQEIATKSKELAELQTRVRNLDLMKNNDKNSQDKRKKELQRLLREADERAKQNKDQADAAKQNILTLSAGVDDLEASLKKDEEEVNNKKKAIEEFQAKLPSAEAELQAALAEEHQVQTKIDEQKSRLRQASSRLAKLSKEADALRREEGKTRQKKEERENEVTRLIEAEKANEKHAKAMEKKNEWIKDEQVNFNKKGGNFDFEGYTTKKGSTEVNELNEKIEKLERCLCVKNVSNLDTCEARVIDIKNKREKLKEDFAMLKTTIAVLDTRKVAELEKAYASIDNDFGKIFNCLLPDADAKLRPPEGKTFHEGSNLHELSGGQRSLVALSLILAMLKFKPAPLYILDEVDAALDLSHTANIGMMIRTHFRNSQFIIVSLKQGMFSNADVIFQTNFADGHSTCTRLVGDALERAKNDARLAIEAVEFDKKQAEEEHQEKQQKKNKNKKNAAEAGPSN